MTLADEVTQSLSAIREELADAFHGDAYEVVRAERREGGDGGWVERPETVVESGRCALLTGGGFGGTQVDEQVIEGLSPHVAELPIDTGVVAGDTIRINGRAYLIEDVKRGGNHRLFVGASLRERGSGG